MIVLVDGGAEGELANSINLKIFNRCSLVNSSSASPSSNNQFLPPAMKLGQGNIFTGVCDSVHGVGGLPQCMLGYHPPGTRQGLSSFYVSHQFCCDISFGLNFLQCINAVRVLTYYLRSFECVGTAVSDIFEAFTVYMSIQMAMFVYSGSVF